MIALTGERVALGAILVSLVLVLGGLVFLRGCQSERERADRAAVTANAAVIAKDSTAREAAADERLADARANAEMKQDLSHAVDDLPDARPSDRRRALACARLRRQGTDIATLPACQRLEGGAQAPA